MPKRMASGRTEVGSGKLAGVEKTQMVRPADVAMLEILISNPRSMEPTVKTAFWAETLTHHGGRHTIYRQSLDSLLVPCS
jgi:hypothetical protein